MPLTEKAQKILEILSNDSPKVESPPVIEKDYEKKYFSDDKIDPIETKWRALPFPNPHFFVSFYNKYIAEGVVTLHKWQAEDLELLGCENKKPSSQHPFKYCLITCNGSGKDAFIIASFAVWFCGSKVRSRCIITSSSGVQLTSQTEGYIRTLCYAVNEKHGCEIFKVRQRFITCRLSGSEIRFFATDEEGKAEGYHPIEPNAEMAIIINEAKSVTKEIHRALRRCTGYNYWLEISTPGEPSGDFYKAATTWPYVRRVTYKECPHLSEDEYADDIANEGEHSAYVRSKWLALFTSESGKTVISQELIENLLKNPPTQKIKFKDVRIGIDLAAGGDENVVVAIDGSKCILEKYFRDRDTFRAAGRINDILERDLKLDKSCEYIYGDDGGVGRAILDTLEDLYGWKINRVMNQWAATNKKRYGNKGAENWQRCARILEERLFDVSTVSETCRTQLYTRHFRDSQNSGRLFLESKAQAKAEGRPSPDRADALILALTGLTVDEFLKAQDDKHVAANREPPRKFTSAQAAYEHYETNETYGKFNSPEEKQKRRVFNSLQTALARQGHE